MIDTSSVVQARREAWSAKTRARVFAALTEMVAQGKLFFPVEVYRELDRGADTLPEGKPDEGSGRFWNPAPHSATLRPMDPAGLPALIEAIRHLHGLEAIWLESVPVHETHEGQTVWEGEVQVFAVSHPKASRVYAWSHESGEGGRRRFHVVLGAEPVDSAEMAVRTAALGAASKPGPR